jgi:sugar phosphate isomerase/epimerase
MITISAFADEIAPDLRTQMDTCRANGITHIDVRAIDGKNVSQMTPAKARRYRRQMDAEGFSVPCLGSPVGKIRLDEDFQSHLELLKRCCDLAAEFGTSHIRVFSFYPSPGRNIADERPAVLDRLQAMVRLAEQANVTLLHENEKGIYGATPAGVLDIFRTVRSPHLECLFDPANFVEEGFAPYDEAWRAGLDELTTYIHIKDKVPGSAVCVPAGQGRGQIPEIFTDLRGRGWSGVMTLEPHLQAAGRMDGFTGPDLFTQAAGALKKLCEHMGLTYR